MQQVVIHRYGPAAEVLVAEEAPRPTIGKDEVLVRQYATSVNPIDCRMRRGYGRVVFARMRGYEFPLVLGRDVSGEIVEVGPGVAGLSQGDAVYGVTRAKRHGGAYAEYVVSTPNEVVRKPESLSYAEAAALPYVACTVWAALVTKAGLTEHTAPGKKVFVQAGAGGIGSFAIQLLKSWGAHVATTCSEAQIESLRALGADVIVNYEREDYAGLLTDFDVALETIGGTLEEKTLGILRKDGQGTFVTLIHPLLRNFDEAGLIVGAARNVLAFRASKRRATQLGVRSYHWAAFKPSAEALTTVRQLVDAGHVRPHIDSEFSLGDLAKAHEYCELGRANGKIIVSVGEATTR